MSVTRLRGAPRPDSEVVEALEKALEAAKKGHVRAALVVLVDPLQMAEHAAVGDLPRCRTVLIGGMSVAAHKLLQELI